MKNKNIFITGATDGIGRATAKMLSKKGANLYVLCRNSTKGEKLRNELKQLNPEAKVMLFIADLGNFQEVRQVAAKFLDLNIALDVLINNAGVLNNSRILLPNGLEQMFAVNHLGHFLLTQLLMNSLKKANASRIVVVASDGYILCKGIQFDNLEWNQGFKTFKTYGHSKLANILFFLALAKRLEGTSITVNALHPGEVSTNLGKQNKWWLNYIFKLASPFFKTAEKAAKTTLYLASSAELNGVNGEYFKNCKVHHIKPWAKDMQQAERLWKVSETLVAR